MIKLPFRYSLFLLLLPAVFLLSLRGKAQNHGNEWINYNQQYFAIPVAEEGVYRVGFDALLAAGVPLGSFDPRSFQVFANGEQQPALVTSENTGNFQPGDYIEFYAQKNTGWFDSGFYEDPAKHPNPNYSLINDTITYYITWGSQLNNERYAVEEDNDFGGYTPAPYAWYTSRQDYTNSYYSGETNNYGVTEPGYVEAEGWFGPPINVGQSATRTISTPSVYTAGPHAEIEFAIAGASNYRPMNPDHHLQVQFAGENIDTLFEGYRLLRFSENVSPTNLNESGTPFVFSSVNSLSTPVDRSTVSYISVRYPRVFDFSEMENVSLELPVSSGEKTFIEFSGFNVQEDDPVWIYNFTSQTKTRAYFSNGNFRALISQPNRQRELYITSESQVKNVSKLYAVNNDPSNFARFINYNSEEYRNSDYIIISHALLMDEAESYRDFRTSTGYKVLVADVEQLYHQFGYGIKKHPLSIRHFLAYLLDAYDQPPEYLFLIGKGRTAPSYRKNPSVYASTLVPSYGNPASDVLLSSGLDGNGYAPALATGRLAARNPEHASWYLDKAIQHHDAQQQPREWMKNILHFGGGSSVSEQNVLKTYLRRYERILEDTLFGGYIRTFLKSSTDPIQINQSDSLKQIINNGVSMMVFFGHAAGIGFDISIDYPSEYSNFGKYPFLVANSCFAGDIFGGGISSSEEFVIIREKGVIGYIAATTATGAFELNQYSTEFFHNLSAVHYGKPVGYSLRETIRNIQSDNLYIKNVSLLKTLHGDPAVILNAHPNPDYTVESKDIFFTPKEVTAEMDSFYVNIVATNIGKSIRDSVFLDLERKFPDGTIENIQKRILTPMFKDTIAFRLPVDRESGAGINQFVVTLDALNEVEELDISNNSASNNLFIKSSDVIPVLPQNNAIVSESQVTLKASTGNPFADERTYVFEIDTTPSFNMPLGQHYLTQSGGVLEWRPPLSLTDSTVYFWRVSMDSVYTGSYNWRSSDFQYISDKKGWSQAKFDQFGNNDYTYVSWNEEQRKWDFVNTIHTISAQTGVYPYLVWNEQFVRKNGVTIEVFSCLADVGNGMYFAVFDPVSAEHWISYNQGNNLGQYDNYHCRQRPNGTFDFYSTSETWRERMRRFIDTIPDGHYVLAVSHRNHNAENYPEELYASFESLGSANIRNIPNNTPYLLFGVKGSPVGSSNEVIGASVTSHIQINDSILTNWDKGSIRSKAIGPASEWKEIRWQQSSVEPESTDSVWMDVLGISAAGVADTLLKDIPATEQVIDMENQKIDAQKYPFLQLQVSMMDEENRTPAQMDYWQVYYEGIPEIALNPSRHFLLESDTIKQGKNLTFSTGIENISAYDMDSMKVNYWVMDENRQMHLLDYPRQKPLLAGEILIDTISIPTTDIAGDNELWVEVNPGLDQFEQYQFNNIGQIPFFVEKDKTNPLLEVTFDGTQIMDGEIVSANPFIQIHLSDENNFLALDDTTLVKVFISTPESGDFQRVYFHADGEERMRFYPASLPDNQCTIEFEPVFEMDGEYTLRVQATDKTQNESGIHDYVISFEVINRSTITELLNWPNPFTTATHFVFTLTGSELPTFMKIQILTVTGKVVREIDMSELGALRIGKNITSYAWDGTDQYGDRLANGVYLYRVITHINGEQIELNSTEAGKYFKEGFGKMYLMR